jgi:hypothetical protein
MFVSREISAFDDITQGVVILFSNYRHMQYFTMIYNVFEMAKDLFILLSSPSLKLTRFSVEP